MFWQNRYLSFLKLMSFSAKTENKEMESFLQVSLNKVDHLHIMSKTESQGQLDFFN